MRRQTNPFGELERLLERLEENLEEAARKWDAGRFETATTTTGSMRVDLEDAGEELVMTADLPGFERDDIDVRVTGRTLRVTAEHEAEETEDREGEYFRRERHHASVSRSLTLPEPVERDEVSASFRNGVLTVRMPRTEPSTEGTRIEID